MRAVPPLVLAILFLPLLAWCLDEKSLRTYETKLQAATAAFAKDDFTKCEQALAEADALWPGQPQSLNLRGALHYKRKEYAAALADFEALLKAIPESYTALFNIAGVKLAQKKYDEALQVYRQILEKRTDEASQFKMVVAMILQGNPVEAAKYAEKIAHPGQSPAYFYAQAALAFSSGNQDKGRGWLKQAEMFYPAESITFYRQNLVENGWLKE